MSTWWVLRYAPNGRGFLVDIPFASELRADRYLERYCDGQGKVLETESRNKKNASREIRQQVSEMHDPNLQWGKNFRHKEKKSAEV